MAAEYKSNIVPGDLADRMGKREFPEEEETPNFYGTDLHKRVRVSSDKLFGKEKTEEKEEASGTEGTELSGGVDNNECEGTHDLVLSQCGSVDFAGVPESQESKNGDECACETDGGSNSDSIKACSCSFCTKAAYIWLDLNYQDIKARVSALRKSRKEATIAAERSIWNHSGSVEYFSESEYDLMFRWRSLFQRMAEVNEQESIQLEARLLQLNGLRDGCKMDSEMTGEELKRP